MFLIYVFAATIINQKTKQIYKINTNKLKQHNTFI